MQASNFGAPQQRPGGFGGAPAPNQGNAPVPPGGFKSRHGYIPPASSLNKGSNMQFGSTFNSGGVNNSNLYGFNG